MSFAVDALARDFSDEWFGRICSLPSFFATCDDTATGAPTSGPSSHSTDFRRAVILRSHTLNTDYQSKAGPGKVGSATFVDITFSWQRSQTTRNLSAAASTESTSLRFAASADFLLSTVNSRAYRVYCGRRKSQGTLVPFGEQLFNAPISAQWKQAERPLRRRKGGKLLARLSGT